MNMADLGHKYGFRFLNIFSLLAFLCLSAPTVYAWDQKIFSVSPVHEISPKDFFEQLSDANTIVLGEKHSNDKIQTTQAKVIKGVLDTLNNTSNFTLAWEFLDKIDAVKIKKAYDMVLRGVLSSSDFLLAIHGSHSTQSYIPIIEVAKKYGGQLLPVNLSREQKAPVVERGLQGADPALIPTNFEMGSDAYFERFIEAMGGHGDMQKINNYFAAQCLTDDVMAYSILNNSNFDLTFLVTGHFHSDYDQGVVARLLARAPGERLYNVRFIDASDYTQAELLQMLEHPKYGSLADFVVFVNEPV